MPTILMHMENGEMLGFLRVAGEEALSAGTTTRECVLTEVPGSAQLFDRPVNVVGRQRSDFAYPALVRVDGEHVTLCINLLNTSLLLDLVERRGQWHVEVDGRRSLFGACEELTE